MNDSAVFSDDLHELFSEFGMKLEALILAEMTGLIRNGDAVSARLKSDWAENLDRVMTRQDLTIVMPDEFPNDLNEREFSDQRANLRLAVAGQLWDFMLAMGEEWCAVCGHDREND